MRTPSTAKRVEAGPKPEDVCHICRLKDRIKVSACYCITCDMQLCKSCSDQHRLARVTSDHQVVSKNRPLNVPTCTKHRLAPIKYHCNDCGEFVCVNCTMIDHKGHNIVDIRAKARHSRKFLHTAVDSLNSKLLAIDAEMRKIKELEANIEQSRRKMKGSLNKQVKVLAQGLRSQHEEVVSTVDSHCNKYLDDLANQKDELKVNFEHINSLKRTVEKGANTGSEGKLVTNGFKMEKDVEDALDIKVKPVHVAFKTLEFVLTNNGTLGSMEVRRVNEPVVDMKPLAPHSACPDEGHMVNTMWTTLRVLYRYRTICYLKEPSGIAVLPTGRYVVSDYSNHGLLTCDRTGRFQQRVLLLEASRPTGVAVTLSGNIAVTSDGSVKMFKPSRLLAKTTQFSIQPGPGAMTVDDTGRYVISDMRTRRVTIYDEDGRHLAETFETSDKTSSPPDMFNLSARGNHIALSYQYASKFYIRLYSYDGSIVHSTQIPHPCTGIYVDRIGNTLVATAEGVYVMPAGRHVMQQLIILDKNNRSLSLNARLIGLTPDGNILTVHVNHTANRSEIVLLQPLVPPSTG